jgi:hypothetical protein
MLALIAPNVAAAAPTALWEIKMQVQWGPCGNDREIADGTLTLDSNHVAGLIRTSDGNAVFSSTLGKDGIIKSEFQIGSTGDGFRISGHLHEAGGQGTWDSPTLSCGGKWNATRLERR